MASFDMDRCHKYVLHKCSAVFAINEDDWPTKKDLKHLYKHKCTDTKKWTEENNSVTGIAIEQHHLDRLTNNQWLTTNIIERFVMKEKQLAFLEVEKMLYIPSEAAQSIFVNGKFTNRSGKIQMAKAIEKVIILIIYIFKIFK